jgi:AcrR family transcriptional regulator
MLRNTATAKRPRGRPQVRSDDETRRVVIEAAAQEFQAHGYAATTMGALAHRAGISTRTLYRFVPAKDALFRAVLTDRIGRFMLAIDEGTTGALDLVGALERLLTAYGALTLTEETIAISRLVLSERDRFPAISSSFYETAVLRTNQAIVAMLERLRAQGLIRFDDADMAAGMLRGMMIHESHRAVMLGQQAAPSFDEIIERAKACARLFLDGCKA